MPVAVAELRPSVVVPPPAVGVVNVPPAALATTLIVPALVIVPDTGLPAVVNPPPPVGVTVGVFVTLIPTA